MITCAEKEKDYSDTSPIFLPNFVTEDVIILPRNNATKPPSPAKYSSGGSVTNQTAAVRDLTITSSHTETTNRQEFHF